MINNFNNITTTPLGEWSDFLKNEEIKDEFKAKGIEEGMEKGKVEVALRLIDKGMTVEKAAEIAEVSVEVLRGAVGKE